MNNAALVAPASAGGFPDASAETGAYADFGELKLAPPRLPGWPKAMCGSSAANADHRAAGRQQPVLARVILQLRLELRIRDSDQRLGALADRLAVQVRHPVFGDHVMHVAARRHYARPRTQ